MNLKNLADIYTGVKIIQSSSSHNQITYDPNNVLTNNRTEFWMSASGLPQYLVIDLSNIHYKYDYVSLIGFDCWHQYQTNPKLIQIFVKQDQNQQEFDHWATLRAKKKSGKQIFQISHLPSSFKLIKFQVAQTFGAFQTYINQIFIYGQKYQKQIEQMTSRHFNVFQNQLQLRQTDRNDKDSFNHFNSSHQPSRKRVISNQQQSQLLQNNLTMMGISNKMVQIQQNMVRLNRKVDQLDLKIQVSHNNTEQRILIKVKQYIQQKLKDRDQKQKVNRQQNINKDERQKKLVILAKQLNQKMKQRQRKILQLSRKKSQKKNHRIRQQQQ